jgi:serine/threonine-protein kinase RsbW
MYSGSADQVRAVRAELRAALRGCPVSDDVILCASELAANAILHSHSCLPGGTFTVRAIISPGEYVQIEVEDNGGPWTPGVGDATQRHGLDIIPSLASEWGIDGDQSGRTVWARFGWPKHHGDAGFLLPGTRLPP